MFVLSVVFPVKKREQKKKKIHGISYTWVKHPFSREAKWSLLELISPHLLKCNSTIMDHWNSLALWLGIKILLEVFFSYGSEKGDPFIYETAAEAMLGCTGKEIKGDLLVTQVLLRVKLCIYSFSVTNSIGMSPQWHTLRVKRVLGSTDLQRPCHLAALIVV